MKTLSHLLDSDGFNQLRRGRNGYYLYNTRDIYIGRSIEHYGEFSGLELQFLEQLCASGSVVIEAGANIGAHTVGLAKRIGPQGRLLAFEPQRITYQTLCANVAINSLTNVDCFWAALGDTRGQVVIPELDPTQSNNFGGLAIGGYTQGRLVPCHTLDDFLSLTKLDLIKMDVEGMEAKVIQGGSQIIAKFKPYLYLENDRVENSETLMRLIDGLGYRMYWHMPPLFDPKNYAQNPENLFPNIKSCNMLCIHRDANVVVTEVQPVEDFTTHPLKPLST